MVPHGGSKCTKCTTFFGIIQCYRQADGEPALEIKKSSFAYMMVCPKIAYCTLQIQSYEWVISRIQYMEVR